MKPEFYSHLDTKSKYLSFRRFLIWFSPAMLILAIVLTIVYRERFPEIFPGFILCAIGSITLAWFFNQKVLATADSGQTWKVAHGHAIYESCSPVLGKSFNVPVEDIESLVIIDECQTAECVLKDGSKHEFPADDREGREFFKYVKSLLD